MKVRVPILIEDLEVTRHKGMEPTEDVALEEDFFLDGPVTRRIAVLDFDHTTGRLLPGARFQPPGSGETKGGYRFAAGPDPTARDFAQVSVFGTAMRTIYMFEEPDALGRPLTWAFNAPQLLIVPRAGEWPNAFYERESHSLQFFSFKPAHAPNRWVHTGLSHDIVAHETAHAVLDGIAPDLYHAISPQSLALHEAIADLTALLTAFRLRSLRQTVLMQTGGSIRNSTAFSVIAEEFAGGLDPRRGYLRNLLNDRTLRPNDPYLVDRAEPHELSEVLSGALYAVMVRLHETLRDEYKAKRKPPETLVESWEGEMTGASGEMDAAVRALAIGAERFKRTILRGLDYMPPGEVSFADYGRAIIAADQASHPDSGQQRQWLVDEFVRRGIVADPGALRMKTGYATTALDGLDLTALVESDWVAYEFANRHRQFLGIPPEIPFRVWPRLDVRKLYYHRDGRREVRECLFKVSWTRTEANRLGVGLPSRRQIMEGTTLAVDWDSREVRVLLKPGRDRQQVRDRDAFLLHLLGRDQLQLEEAGPTPEEGPLRSAIRAVDMNGVLRVRGTARMLHLVEDR